MRGTVLAAAMAVLWGSAAGAQVGATAGQPMQPGGWGRGGWQSGAGPVSTTPPIDMAPAAAAPPRLDYAPTAAMPAPQAAYGAPYAPPPAYGTGYAPPSRAYRPVGVGGKLPRGYVDPIYTVHDWRSYGLGQPYPGTRWIRYFDDAVLADARGRAIDVRRVAWDAPRAAGRPAPMPAAAAQWTPPVASTRTERHGDTVVTTQVIPPPRAYYGGGYGPDYGWGPGVTVTPSVVTTTTTTVTDPAPRSTRYRRARRR